MTSATKRFAQLVGAKDCFDITPDELLPVQLKAANERLGTQVESIPLLANRAESASLNEITQPADLVPLLFAHTTYKTYGEVWLNERRWDRMGKWLATVSTRPVEGLDTDGVQTLDDWIKQSRPPDTFCRAPVEPLESRPCCRAPRATSSCRHGSTSRHCCGRRVSLGARTANSLAWGRSSPPRAGCDPAGDGGLLFFPIPAVSVR